MDRSLLRYYLGRWADANDLSPQCTGVRDLMLAKKVGDHSRLKAVLEFLAGSDPIQDDTVTWLRRGIRGHYGGEGYVLNVTAQEEAAFWLTLHERYPTNAWLCFVAADARFGWDTPASLRRPLLVQIPSQIPLQLSLCVPM